jgi:hypothetical protein
MGRRARVLRSSGRQGLCRPADGLFVDGFDVPIATRSGHFFAQVGLGLQAVAAPVQPGFGHSLESHEEVPPFPSQCS